MYTTSWITYLFNLFMAYATYYVTYFIDLFREYPIEVRIAAINTTASLLGIVAIRLLLLRKRNSRRLNKKIREKIKRRFGKGLDYIISEEANPNMSRREVMHAMGIEKDIAEKKAILKTKREKWIFCRLVYRACTSCSVQKGRWNNLQMMLTLFKMQEYLESEVSMGSRRHRVKCLSMLRTFKLYISPWVLNKLLESHNLRERRLAMYAMVMSSTDNDLDYYETDFFDKNCCIYDEIELGYALHRRKRNGLRLPNLATWALRQEHPETKCIFVRLMRRFDQKEYCGQLIELYKESKHKKLIEEISRTWGYLYYKDSGNYNDNSIWNQRTWNTGTGLSGNTYYIMNGQTQNKLEQFTTSWGLFPHIRPSSNDEVPYFYVTVKQNDGSLIQLKTVSYTEFMLDVANVHSAVALVVDEH